MKKRSVTTGASTTATAPAPPATAVEASATQSCEDAHETTTMNAPVVAAAAAKESILSPYSCVNSKHNLRFSVARKIGSGAYGKVFAAWMATGSSAVVCAIKMPTRITSSSVSGITSLKEIDIMSRCHHPYILRLQRVEIDFYKALLESRASTEEGKSEGASASSDAVERDSSSAVSSTLSLVPAEIQTQLKKIVDKNCAVKTAKYDRVSLIFELAIGNTEDIRVHDMSDDKLRLCMAECLLALEYMHAKKIVHRDLKPGNILICAKDSNAEILLRYMQNLQQGNGITPKEQSANRQRISRFLAEPSNTCLKLCDFGMSKICNNYLHTRGVVTLWYRAPEIAAAAPDTGTKYTCASDWWSFGCILYEWVTGTPFAACSTRGDDETQDANLLDLIRTTLDRLEKSNWDVVQNALKARTDFTRSEKTCIGNLIKSFLRIEPQDRMTPSAALDASLFQPLRQKIAQDRLRLPHVEFCAPSYVVQQLQMWSRIDPSSAGGPASAASSEQLVDENNKFTSATSLGQISIQCVPKESSTRQFVLSHIARLSPGTRSEEVDAGLDQVLSFRENAYMFATELFRTRYERHHYHTNRRLFLALELFDRFCLWLLCERSNSSSASAKAAASASAPLDELSRSVLEPILKTDVGSSPISAAERIGVLFVVLYYIAVKVLSSFEPSILLKSLLTRKIWMDSSFSPAYFEHLELFLLRDVFHFQVGPNRVVKSFDRPHAAAFASVGRTIPKGRKKRTELTYMNSYEALCGCSEAINDAAVLPLQLLHWKQRSSFYEFVRLFVPSSA